MCSLMIADLTQGDTLGEGHRKVGRYCFSVLLRDTGLPTGPLCRHSLSLYIIVHIPTKCLNLPCSFVFSLRLSLRNHTTDNQQLYHSLFVKRLKTSWTCILSHRRCVPIKLDTHDFILTFFSFETWVTSFFLLQLLRWERRRNTNLERNTR